MNDRPKTARAAVVETMLEVPAPWVPHPFEGCSEST